MSRNFELMRQAGKGIGQRKPSHMAVDPLDHSVSATTRLERTRAGGNQAFAVVARSRNPSEALEGVRIVCLRRHGHSSSCYYVHHTYL